MSSSPATTTTGSTRPVPTTNTNDNDMVIMETEGTCVLCASVTPVSDESVCVCGGLVYSGRVVGRSGDGYTTRFVCVCVCFVKIKQPQPSAVRVLYNESLLQRLPKGQLGRPQSLLQSEPRLSTQLLIDC